MATKTRQKMSSEKDLWSKYRVSIRLDKDFSPNWSYSIKLFKQRLQNKYFHPTQKLIDSDTLKGEGFSILTVQCALIEMFAAFKDGKIYNHAKTNTSPPYEYKDCEKLFINFLRTEEIFKDIFWRLNNKGKPSIDMPYNAKTFYAEVRCGLMHEARTKGNWYIKASKKSSIYGSSPLIVVSDHKVKIDRTVLHYKLQNYLESYILELKENTARGQALRKHFARKMDNLYDFPADTSYYWWT